MCVSGLLLMLFFFGVVVVVVVAAGLFDCFVLFCFVLFFSSNGTLQNFLKLV